MNQNLTQFVSSFTDEEKETFIKGAAIRGAWYKACFQVMRKCALPGWKQYCRIQFAQMTPEQKHRVEQLAEEYAMDRGFKGFDLELVKASAQLVKKWHNELRMIAKES